MIQRKFILFDKNDTAIESLVPTVSSGYKGVKFILMEKDNETIVVAQHCLAHNGLPLLINSDPFSCKGIVGGGFLDFFIENDVLKKILIQKERSRNYGDVDKNLIADILKENYGDSVIIEIETEKEEKKSFFQKLFG